MRMDKENEVSQNSKVRTGFVKVDLCLATFLEFSTTNGRRAKDSSALFSLITVAYHPY